MAIVKSIQQTVLDLPMMSEDNHIVVATVRGYLKELLAELWREKDGFDGKRPFGDSGWEHDIYAALVQGGFLQWSDDGEGYLLTADREAADKLILKAIGSLS